MLHPTWLSKCPERVLPFLGSSTMERIRPGTTGLRFTRAKHSSVLRNTTEGLIRCCPNLSMVRVDLQGLKETMVKIIKGLTLPFQATGINQTAYVASSTKCLLGSKHWVSWNGFSIFPKMIMALKEWWKRLLSKAKNLHIISYTLLSLSWQGYQTLGNAISPSHSHLSCIVNIWVMCSLKSTNRISHFFCHNANQCTKDLRNKPHFLNLSIKYLN